MTSTSHETSRLQFEARSKHKQEVFEVVYRASVSVMLAVRFGSLTSSCCMLSFCSPRRLKRHSSSQTRWKEKKNPNDFNGQNRFVWAHTKHMDEKRAAIFGLPATGHAVISRCFRICPARLSSIARSIVGDNPAAFNHGFLND